MIIASLARPKKSEKYKTQIHFTPFSLSWLHQNDNAICKNWNRKGQRQVFCLFPFLVNAFVPCLSEHFRFL